MASEFLPVAIAQLWQVTLLIVFVAAVTRWLARRPHLTHLLWVVVLVKCLTPPLWSSDTGVFCWLQPEDRVEASAAVADRIDVEWQLVEWQELLVVDSAQDSLPSDVGQLSAGIPLSDHEPIELLGQEPESAAVVDSRDVWSARLSNVWLAMVASVLLIMAVRWWRFWRRLNLAPRRECKELEELVGQLARQLGVKRVRLLVTESRIGPAVVGIFRKTILLPAVVVDRLAGDRESRLPLKPILAHELLHARRGDLWVGLLQTVAQAVWWFHPLVWWVARVATREAERCCDEEVLAELNCDPAMYARSLLDVLELKSQLTPVPVFPGVRPVDVTSKRLERIMTLGQGCRRRTPWWCWLIALGTAALTLPGAAFVVSAQEEAPQQPVPANIAPAPPEGGKPGPPRPFPEKPLFRAFDASDRDSTETTEVYETAEFAHLLGGSKAEQRQKFERLIRSREQAKDAQINWYNDKPVVRTTNAGHRAAREFIAVLLGSETTAKQFDEFLDNVANRVREKVVIDLQFVTMNDDAYSDIEDKLIEMAEKKQGPDEFPLVMPAEQWDELNEAVPHDDAWKYVAPQLAAYNGRTVHIESVGHYPPVYIGFGSPDHTSGDLLEPPEWVGWKALALPVVRDDGDSFWLAMRFEVRSLAEDDHEPARSDGMNPPIRRHEVGFTATLREKQVVVIPGLNIRFGGTSGTSGSTFLAARIRRLVPMASSGTQSSRRSMPGVGVNSNAGLAGTIDIQTNATDQPETASAPPANQPFHIRYRIGPVMVEADQRGAGTTSPKLTVKVTNQGGRVVFVGTADAIGFRDRDGDVSLKLSQPRLRVPMPGGHRLEAQELRLSARTGTDDSPKASIHLKLDDAAVWLEHAEQGNSQLRADHLSIVLNVETTDVEQLDGEGLKLLKTGAPVSTNATDEPENETSSAERKARRVRQLEAQRLNTSQAIAGPYANNVEAKLNRKTVVSFQSVPLADAMRSLALQHDLNICLDQRGLEEEGVTTQTPVSLEVSGVALRSVLTLILDPLNLGTKLGEDEVIIVTSRQRIAGALAARAYAVADLVVPIPDRVGIHTDGMREIPLDARTAADSANIDSAARPWEQSGSATPVTKPAPQFDFEKLTKLITSTIEPDSWSEMGGSGSIAANETTLCLVIRQTPAVHAEIADLLQQLRRLQDIQVCVQMQTCEVPESFLKDWDVDRLFRPLGESKSHRYIRLSPAQVEQLRSGSQSSQRPKVTLFNGQTVSWGHTGADGQSQLWRLQPVMSADRRIVRLRIGIDQRRAGSPDNVAPTSAVPTPVVTIPDQNAVLIESLKPSESANAASRVTGLPYRGQPQEFEQEPSPRHFLLVQTNIVVAADEKELFERDRTTSASVEN